MFSRYGHKIEFMTILHTMSINKGINSVLGQDSYTWRCKPLKVDTNSK